MKMKSYTLTSLTVDAAKMIMTVDCQELTTMLAKVEEELTTYIATRKSLLLHKDLLSVKAIRDINKDIQYQAGYIAALSGIAYLCGEDFYFHEGKPCKDAFSEYPDAGLNETKLWTDTEHKLIGLAFSDTVL